MASIQWLETYLSNYKGSVLIVSHDRFFLDCITEKVVEIEHGKVTVFSGNYTAYAQKKEQLRHTLQKQYENYPGKIHPAGGKPRKDVTKNDTGRKTRRCRPNDAF